MVVRVASSRLDQAVEAYIVEQVLLAADLLEQSSTPRVKVLGAFAEVSVFPRQKTMIQACTVPCYMYTDKQ